MQIIICDNTALTSFHACGGNLQCNYRFSFPEVIDFQAGHLKVPPFNLHNRRMNGRFIETSAIGPKTLCCLWENVQNQMWKIYVFYLILQYERNELRFVRLNHLDTPPPPLLCALHEVHPELSAQSIVLNEVCLPAGWQQMFTTGHVECAESYHKICCARGHISVVLVVFLNKGIQFESGINHLHMLSLKDILQWCVHLSFFW